MKMPDLNALFASTRSQTAAERHAAHCVLPLALLGVLLACIPLPAAAVEQGRHSMQGSTMTDTCIDAAVAEYLNAQEHQEDVRNPDTEGYAGVAAGSMHTAHGTVPPCVHDQLEHATDWEDGTVLEPFPQEIQALITTDPASTLVQFQDDLRTHADHVIEAAQSDPDLKAAAADALPSIERRSLLHGRHKKNFQGVVCPRCRTVVCRTGKGFCNGHCKSGGALYRCRVPIIGPPVPPDAPPLVPPVDSDGDPVPLSDIYLGEIAAVTVRAEKPYVGCTDEDVDDSGCPSGSGFYASNNRKGQALQVANGQVKATCAFSDTPVPLRWYDQNIDDRVVAVGVCSCTYVSGEGELTAGPCEAADPTSVKIDTDGPKPYEYPPQIVDVAGTPVKISITAVSELDSGEAGTYIGIQDEEVDDEGFNLEELLSRFRT